MATTNTTVVTGNPNIRFNTAPDIELGDGDNFVAVAGHRTVTVGNGNNTIAMENDGNVLTTGSGNNTITVGPPLAKVAHDHAVAITADTLNLGNGRNTLFLYGSGNTINLGSGSLTSTELYASNNTYVLAQAGGSLGITRFAASQGDRLDLSKILAGVDLAPDLSNLANFVSVSAVTTRAGSIDTVLNITGSSGHETVTLFGAGALSLSSLQNGVLVLPPH
jgi:hypothetical protein